uniref:Uncharacterized protein n=1 Tax=Macrostomum lignano TaxID=282301 RepID=A0A1I8FPI0_9PLAT
MLTAEAISCYTCTGTGVQREFHEQRSDHSERLQLLRIRPRTRSATFPYCCDGNLCNSGERLRGLSWLLLLLPAAALAAISCRHFYSRAATGRRPFAAEPQPRAPHAPPSLPQPLGPPLPCAVGSSWSTCACTSWPEQPSSAAATTSARARLRARRTATVAFAAANARAVRLSLPPLASWQAAGGRNEVSPFVTWQKPTCGCHFSRDTDNRRVRARAAARQPVALWGPRIAAGQRVMS